MTSIFREIRSAVMTAESTAGFPVTKILSILGIARAWYYRHLDPLNTPDNRFNPYAVRDEEWLVVGYRKSHPRMGFREITYAMIDEDIAYLSESTVYRILKKHDLITEWNRIKKEHIRPEWAQEPDQKWQSDIMYLKVNGRFFYLLIFMDEYSRYIVHHALLTTMDADSVSIQAQIAIEKLRKDSLATPIIQTDNGSAFISMEFKIVLRENSLTHKRIHPHSPTDNALIERGNRTVREEADSRIMVNYQDAVSTIDEIVIWYNTKRRHSSLHYLTPKDYYRGDPEDLLRNRKFKLDKARSIRKEMNMMKRKGGEAAKSTS
jgi:transposase InsO family protein